MYLDKFKSFYEENKVSIGKILSIITFFGVTYIFINYIFILVAPFVIGYIISICLEPLVKLFTKKFNIGRGISAVLSIFIMVISIGGILYLIGYNAVTQGRNLFLYHSDDILREGKVAWESIKEISSNLFFYVPTSIQKGVNTFFVTLNKNIVGLFSQVVKNAGISFAKFVPKFFVYTFLGLFSSFFFIKDKELINTTCRNLAPAIIVRNVRSIKSSISTALLGYIKAQLIIMCFCFGICLIGLLIIGNPYAFLLALLIGMIDVLPMFGSGFILWPLSIVAFFNGDAKTGIGALIIYGTVQLSRQLLEPKVLGHQIGLHPLITLMSIYIGLMLFGVVGLIVGPMTAIIIKTIWTRDGY